MPDTPISLFISYAHADSAFVDRLQADLRQQGIDPWVDRERLAGGVRWRRELQAAVDRAQMLLVVLSPEAVASENVQQEYGYANEEGKVVIPLYYRACKVPLELRGIVWIDFQHSYEQGLAALVPVLHMQQDKATPTPLSAQTQPGDLGQQPGQKEPAETGHPAFNNLPAQLTPLIGREQELQAVCALMHQPEVRLVTLLGPGGVGKTRLGLAVAQSMLSGFAEGVCFVPLASIRNAEQVIPTIAKTLDLWEAREQPLLSQLQAALHEKHFLLLLDNFEQIVPAAPALTDLLASCPHLALLVTSRSALHLVGEYEFPVPPLPTPDLTQLPESQQLAHNAAVALFVARAQAMQPSFRLTPANANAIAAICVRLEGLPLAIELAAARSKLLPPEALLKRLSRRFEVLTRGAQNLPSRQQTLRNTLQWSYDLLTQEEQRLFRWLSVFVGGCILEAAEAVCQGQGKQGIEVLEGVTSLLDKSLLQRTEQEGEEPRLLSLETIREYGWERLQAAGELAAAEQAHASYYLQVAEEAEPQLKGAEQVAWRKQLEHEQQNLRAAIAWALSSGQPEVALRVSCALWSFWIRQGYPREGSDLLEHVLAGSAAAPAPLRAKALFAAGALALAQLDFRRFWQIVEVYQPLAQELGDQQHMAVARLGQGIIALQRHPEAAVWTRLEESLADLKKQGDLSWITMMLYVLGRLALMQGDARRALALLEECLARARAAGDTLFQALPLLLLGQMALTQGDLATAQERLEEEVALSQGTGERMTTPYALTLQGLIRWRQGKMDEAQASFKEGVRLYREQGIGLGIARLLLLLGHIAVEEGNMAEARADYAESLTIAREIEVEGFTATGLKGSGVVVAKAGQLALAARLWGATEQLRESQDISIPAAVYEQAVQAARTQLGEQAFAIAWAEGRTMSLEQVLAALETATLPEAPQMATTIETSSSYPAGLTAREVEVLGLLARGWTDTKIAEQLVISPRTVNTHLTAIYGKIGVTSRSAATRYAIEHKLV